MGHVKPLDNIKLKGSYQSFKFFQHIEKFIRSQLKFHRTTQSAVDSFIREQTPRYLINTPITYNGMHCQRGDFLHPKQRKRGNAVASKDYVNRAKRALKKMYDTFRS